MNDICILINAFTTCGRGRKVIPTNCLNISQVHNQRFKPTNVPNGRMREFVYSSLTRTSVSSVNITIKFSGSSISFAVAGCLDIKVHLWRYNDRWVLLNLGMQRHYDTHCLSKYVRKKLLVHNFLVSKLIFLYIFLSFCLPQKGGSRVEDRCKYDGDVTKKVWKQKKSVENQLKYDLYIYI